MNDTFTIIIAIVLSGILIFVVPLMTMADRTDDIAQLAAEVATKEFGDEIVETRQITPERYHKYLQDLGATGNTYDVQIIIDVLDDTERKKAIQSATSKQGENDSYTIHMSQIKEKIDPSDPTKSPQPYDVKPGDRVRIDAKNTNPTFSQYLQNVWYLISGNNTSVIVVSYSRIV